jgi:hypothetical protein
MTATLCQQCEQHTTVADPVLGKVADARELSFGQEPETEAECAAMQAITVDYHTIQENCRGYVGEVGIHDDNDGAAGDSAPVTSPRPTEQAVSIVVTEMGTRNNAPWAVADYTFPTWWRLVDLLRQPGSARALEHFVKSDRFLKSNNGQKVAGWEAFFLSSLRATEPPTKLSELDDAGRFPAMAALAPWPLPHATRQVQKIIAGMKMQDGQWLVCLEMRLTADVECEDWKNNGDLLDACIAFLRGPVSLIGFLVVCRCGMR